MSNTKNTGGPAFPRPENYGAPGMTLRDHFAGLAMQGHWASQTEESCSLDWMCSNPELADGQLRIVAKLAYAMADAMLIAREQ
jgi:hypothetical protein